MFNLNLKTEEVSTFLKEEARKTKSSQTAYINDELLCLSELPNVFSAADASKLDELKAIKTFLNDELMHRMPELAARTRRDVVQMTLFLMERGLQSLDTPLLSDHLIPHKAPVAPQTPQALDGF